MANSIIYSGIKISKDILESKNINANSSATYLLPAKYNDKTVLAIIPLQVGPAIFSGADISAKQITVRAYVCYI